MNDNPSIANGNAALQTPKGLPGPSVSEPRRKVTSDGVAAQVALVVLLSAASLWLLAPFAGSLVLAWWLADLCQPSQLRLTRWFRGRASWAALTLTIVLVCTVLAPLVLVLVTLTGDAMALVRNVLASQSAKDALAAVVRNDGQQALGWRFDPQQIIGLAQQHGDRALHILSTVAGATAAGALAIFVFLMALYTALAEGPRLRQWLLRYSPLGDTSTRRLGNAFRETGRGLFMSVVLTSLAQALLATGAYLLLGVPRALALGLLTFVAAFVPSVGPALIWAPVAIGLALTGRVFAAIALAVFSALVVGMADNVLRPAFARLGQLQMHSLVVTLSIFGGFAMFGAWGLLFGPLIMRLTLEALAIRYDGVASRRIAT